MFKFASLLSSSSSSLLEAKESARAMTGASPLWPGGSGDPHGSSPFCRIFSPACASTRPTPRPFSMAIVVVVVESSWCIISKSDAWTDSYDSPMPVGDTGCPSPVSNPIKCLALAKQKTFKKSRPKLSVEKNSMRLILGSPCKDTSRCVSNTNTRTAFCVTTIVIPMSVVTLMSGGTSSMVSTIFRLARCRIRLACWSPPHGWHVWSN
mmetsp:Transcript_6442/g.11743  ORF Transcript_6442/g.11743 Transcript_6442/m.11743 type:complete len:208 (+) Transcript_6442:338-961(+)